jgi:sugar phosphate isomerase/epimerase
MLGVSLPFSLLANSGDNQIYHRMMAEYNHDISRMYTELHDMDVESIELRAVRDDTDPDLVLRIVQECRSLGFQVTIHGTMRSLDDWERFFDPYHSLISSSLQERYIITVHSLSDKDKTIQTLKSLSLYADKNTPTLYFALENNRVKMPPNPGQHCSLVSEMIKMIDHPRVGGCWDFGHFYFNITNAFEGTGQYPPEDFLKSVVHTHIHGVTNNTTHFPLYEENLPLKSYCQVLADMGYRGVYNLELDFPRFHQQYDSLMALRDSIRVLQKTISDVQHLEAY